MIGLLVVAHGHLGESLIDSAAYVLGRRPERALALDLPCDSDTESLVAAARSAVAALDDGDGVLVMADIYGATPCNTVCKLIEPGHVEAVSGANLPMLLKAITYRQQPLASLAELIVKGAHEGAFHIPPRNCNG